MESIRHIVFDLGGVLIDWDGVTPLTRLTEGRLSFEAARRFWFESPWIARFETGQCSEREFAEGVISELGLELTPDRFIAKFLSWNHGFYPGADSLLEQLRQRYTLSCLTNNNSLYIDNLIDCHGLDRKFDHLFISFCTGLLKPSREVFAYVLAQLGSPPERVLFFDDNIECVEMAQDVGMQACRVSGVEPIIELLTEKRLL